MEFRTKNFPYPFLEKNSSDYKSSFLEIEMDQKRYGSEIEMTFNAELNNNELMELFKMESITITIHIECPATSFREAFSLKKSMETIIRIPEEKLNGKVEISSFIVAVKSIKSYTSKDFDDFLKGYTFDFEVGAIMGAGDQYTLIISKETEELINVVSIFKIVRNPAIKSIDYSTATADERVSIELPEKDYETYKLLRKQVFLQPILSSMIIIPVLTEILSEIKNRGPEEFQDYLWFNSLEEQLNNKFKLSMIDQEFSNYSDKSMFFLAQNLINNPISKGIDTLKTGYNDDGEREEE
ncbi:hypothetical protein ABE945_08505 [Enterococcus gilvus]|uniref:hypothetical protein n=1 Tax=Enterococcus gilvus TaxID=160453 RepID=UPI003D6B79BA